MSSLERTFDPIGIVIDWLDACRERRLADLLELYADEALLDCCSGGRFVGRSGLLVYWSRKLKLAGPGAFVLEEVLPEQGGVCLDYRDYDGRIVKTRFWFDQAGKINRTICVTLDDVADAA